tara:strand:+ start:1035 stop:1550 length:516 start_codon:yes stop_codon:yes gene_type:complete
MTRKHIKIIKSVDKILSITEQIKKDITDNEYINILNELKIIHDNNEAEKYKQYEGEFMVISIREDTTNFGSDNDEENFTTSFSYMPILQDVKQKFRMTHVDYNIIKQRLNVNHSGIRYIHGLSDFNPINSFMDSLTGIDTMANTKITGEKDVEIIRRFSKRVRLINIEEVH